MRATEGETLEKCKTHKVAEEELFLVVVRVLDGALVTSVSALDPLRKKFGCHGSWNASTQVSATHVSGRAWRE
jgi:hypothetical protein